jgi:hypothetical protein
MTERERFEAWFKERLEPDPYPEAYLDDCVLDDDRHTIVYKYGELQRLWEAWQAACEWNGKCATTADAYQIGGDHYMSLAVQPWAAMQSWMSAAEFEGFLRGNAIKYLARAGRKGDELQDLQKAMHYLKKLVELKQNGDA